MGSVKNSLERMDYRDAFPITNRVDASAGVDNTAPSVQPIESTVFADVTLWEACDPALFTNASIWVLANEANKHFSLHVVGDINTLFRALIDCNVQCLAIEHVRFLQT